MRRITVFVTLAVILAWLAWRPTPPASEDPAGRARRSRPAATPEANEPNVGVAATRAGSEAPNAKTEPGAATPRFDDPELRRLLTFLVDPDHAETEFQDQRVAAARSFRRLVASGGPDLIDEAIARMTSGRNDDRRRAQWILAVADVEPTRLASLARSLDPTIGTYPPLRAESFVEVTSLDRPGLYEVVEDDGPIRDIAEDLRVRLWPEIEPRLSERPDSDEQAHWEEWRDKIRPRLLAPWTAIPKSDRRRVDLDGDGRDEIVILARDLVNSWSYHDYRFVAVLERRRDDEPWRVARFTRLRSEEHTTAFVVADVDGDDDPEAIVLTRTSAGWTFDRLRVVDAGAIETPHLTVNEDVGGLRVLGRDRGERPLFVTIDHFLPNRSGHAAIGMGTFARQAVLHEWTNGAFREVGRVWLPFRAR